MWSFADNKIEIIVSLTHPPTKVNDPILFVFTFHIINDFSFSIYFCSRQLKWRNDLRRCDYWNLDVRLDWPTRIQILPNWPTWRTTDAGHRTASMSHWHLHSMGKFREHKFNAIFIILFLMSMFDWAASKPWVVIGLCPPLKYYLRSALNYQIDDDFERGRWNAMRNDGCAAAASAHTITFTRMHLRPAWKMGN